MTSRPSLVLAVAAVMAGAVTAGCSDDGSDADEAAAVAPASVAASTTIPDDRTTPDGTDTPTATPGGTDSTTATPDGAGSTATSAVAPAPSVSTPPARLEVTLDSASDLAEFAARLSASHATMVDPIASDDERSSAGIEYQLLLRVLADRADLDEQVLDAIDPAARPAVERIVRARQFLQQRSAARPPQPLPDELPAWTVVEPEPVDVLLAHYAEAEQLTGVPWYWLAAIHLQETRMGRIRGVSSAGAVGPMQFLPTTWAACCSGDPTVTRDAIIGAATYLAQSGAPDDMAAAVYQYNPNDGYVAVVTAYAESLRDEPELYTGYHAFQVFFGSSVGTVRLPVGYAETAPVDAADYLASNPQHAA